MEPGNECFYIVAYFGEQGTIERSGGVDELCYMRAVKNKMKSEAAARKMRLGE